MYNGTYEDIIAEAERCFLHGKSGTFAVVRDFNGKLWYAGPGVQTDVKLLRLRICERSFDERSFTGILIIRTDPKKGQCWFVFYNPENKNAPYIASSVDENLDCTCSIVAVAPNIPGGINEAIVVQAVFETYGKKVSRIQSNDVAQVLLLQAHLDNDGRSGNNSSVITSSNNLQDQHSTEFGLSDDDITSLWGDREEIVYE